MKRVIPAETTARQQRASDPVASAWVSAHAGSGKTHVLTQRVVRLLLAGVAPSRLICLTFTKAAAANMSERVFRTLAKWTLMPDDELRAAVRATGAAPPRDLDVARKLFAAAVETPGGLKIQTIHAFCERVLHLFPFEANVPADFRVVEDLERLELARTARMQTLAAAAHDPKLATALETIIGETWDGGFENALDDLFARRDFLRDEAALRERLPAALGLAAGDTEASVVHEIVEDGIGWREWNAVADALDLGSKTDKGRSETLRRAAALAPDAVCLQGYLEVYFTDKGQGDLRKAVATGAVEKTAPGLPAKLLAEGERLVALREKLRATRTIARTGALLLLAAEALRRYEEMKRLRSLLDFDDLISRTRNLLLRDGASSWVLYKLDGGVDHILVDEAQDTSEPQWQILEALAEEFTSGLGRSSQVRTFFAVGDEKQSIFSFQGAAPAAFDRMRREFMTRTEKAELRFESVTLDLSFRSAPLVLETVDAVFANDVASRGLMVNPDVTLSHQALKLDVAGYLEIWPPIQAQKEDDPKDWVLPVDLPRETDPPVELARRIARRIATLVAPGSPERVAGEHPGALRPISPGDIMILVRRRDSLFEAMVRALKEARMPVAGADRLDVGKHIAVMDMIAAARTALAPDDDYSLACVLKSPLCGLTDDDLLNFAPRRKVSLWTALCASDDARCRAAAAQIARWRAYADDGKPFDFFSRLLGPEGGRRAFLARIGPEASDALDELMALALEHERQEAPSLAAFVHELETIDLTVKRDMEAAGGLVRVMTVHAAKGLEAKIVFLPDTCATPSASFDSTLFELQTPAGPTLAWSRRKDDDPPAVAQSRAQGRERADDEYRRLLYVALTRAEERLYIAGHCGTKGPAKGCWHELITAALAEGCETAQDPENPDATILRRGHSSTGGEAASAATTSSPVAPDWLRRPAPVEREPAPPLRPSSALAGADRFETADDADERARSGMSRGVIVHALMQSLPDIAAPRRIEVAQRYVRAQAPGVSAAEANAIAAEAVAALAAPDCAPLFGPRSRAEVALAARIERAGRPAIDILGRIDRLAEVGDDVWIADFKTGAPQAVTPAAYLAQLALYRAAVAALYPMRNVRAFVLWTAAARLDEIAGGDLEAALAAL